MTDVAIELEAYRPELTGYCYRMLGSAFEADDAVQDTMVRAWKGFDRFEGRSALRSWLYRIATNVCLSMLTGAQRRVRPMDLGPAGSGHAESPGAPLADATWLGPIPDDPAVVVTARETVRLAFVAALQHLPPRQRAVLILREVLSWSAAETADLLDMTVAGVNSALQRARATMAALDPHAADLRAPADETQNALLERYVRAFEAYDLDALTALLHEDATLSMPPVPLWLRGPADIRAWMSGTGSGCRGSRLVPITINGLPGYGQYRASASGHVPWSIIALEIVDGRIAAVTNFLDTARLFPRFGLPMSYRTAKVARSSAGSSSGTGAPPSARR
ncbi:sigma-70 family RNA polymerase sigma factor [Catenuloplanes atrovinosus]|uniref:RNA polymerase sigma-70 factor (ECF subfamily) n=1 Tax=Catenuloplanes atrovinosus TaxID=137266 RepID=A0AAE3YNN3_9ACTN|nr:sigma-70 family RNA polymerase sigma factor [Catenuloplanes atrovinosus]MDR7275837.1 RNA polymerase sigma-70 factor (ECF subfamily) [Catenuloplanes atrovinosus]